MGNKMVTKCPKCGATAEITGTTTANQTAACENGHTFKPTTGALIQDTQK